jgi:aldehyde:ferredoxin oxidoreductase
MCQLFYLMAVRYLVFKGGYTGKILRVDLANKKASTEELEEKLARAFIGGAGLGIAILYDEVKQGIDPISPKNKLIFSLGPLVGSMAPCCHRMAVVAKSPLTNSVGMALSGGEFPAELKFAGYDVVIVEGAAEKPVYIWVHDDKAEIRDATPFWGIQTLDTQLFIKDALNQPDAKVACIGPAGERLVRYACIINERRAAGRTGLGAVMGSKKLKAIAVCGTNKVNCADEAKFKEALKELYAEMQKSPVLYPAFSKLGTPMVVKRAAELGILPSKNWSATGVFAPVESIGGEAQEKYTIMRRGCYQCPVRCGQTRLVKSGSYAGFMSEGPEFETTYSFGSATGISYMPAIIAADRLCDEFGLDTISAGVVIAFAMELYEQGVLSKEELDGLDLKFGNHEAMIKLLRKIAYREGIGDLLAEGTKRASETIGRGAEKYAINIKGLELPGYDVRGAKAHGLSYATSFTGGDHCRGYAIQEIFDTPVPYGVDRLAIEGKGKLCKWNQDVRTGVCDCMPFCAFPFDMAIAGVATTLLARLYESLTDFRLTAKEVERVGERVNNVARAFSVREDFSRVDDTFPKRIMTEPILGGASKGQLISPEDLKKMLDEYYKARGWDKKTGIPSREKLEELELTYIADDLAKLKKL